MATHDDDEISLLDLLQTVVENLWLLILGPLAVGLVVLGISFAIKPTYTATSRIMPPQQQQGMAAAMLQSLGALGGLASAAGGIKNPNDQYVSLMHSRSVQVALIKRFDLQTRYEVSLVEDARNALTKNSRISSGKDGLIVIDVDDHDPAFAAQLANAYVEEFTRLLDKLAVTEAQQRRVFFEKQLAQAGDKLSQAQQALQAAGVNPDTLKLNPETAVEGVARLQAQITAQEVRVAAMRGRLTEMAPELRQALNELAALRRQLLRANQGGADDQGDGYVARLRDFKYHETLYELFARQYELARVDESREGAVVQVVDVAQAPERKSGPKRGMMVVFSSLMAGMVLLLFVFMRQAVRNAKSDPEAAGKLERLSTTWRKVTGRVVV
jgi:uncharacterized protein involved in exopolysaccharide biosynthesis